MTGRLWDRGEPLDALVLRYTAGEDHALDDRLVAYDVRASRAHAAMLAAAGYLSKDDAAALDAELERLGAEHRAGGWRTSLAEEDAHTALENRLVARLGDAGRRIHLGRSRNDQVLVAVRLWLKDALASTADAVDGVAAALEDLAARDGAVVLPGYTHQQRAMPSTVALWARGYATELRDDAEGLRAAVRRADLCPLGSAAGYGAPGIAVDRAFTARALGFARVHEPVTAPQLSRGKAEAHALFEAALAAQDLGRLAAELCLFATAEFGFVKIPDAFTTGSSMLPQKRNPDVLELARGRTAEAHAALLEALAVVAKLPSGYHRDFQLLKKPLFRGMDATAATAEVMAHVVRGTTFDGARCDAAIDPSLFMAERANRLVVEKGLPFREAYRRVREESAGA